MSAALLELVRDDERRRMGRRALENARRFGPVPVVEQAERLIDEAMAARGTARRVAPERGRIQHALVSQGFAARDAAYAVASGALHTVRRGNR